MAPIFVVVLMLKFMLKLRFPMSKSFFCYNKMFAVFVVGNIPYEATEEHLREIFGQAGPVLSFRLVYDRESGKPKGYGFCEYKDLETAQSAMRNLNGVELHGRNLRVDSAASEKNKEENRGLYHVKEQLSYMLMEISVVPFPYTLVMLKICNLVTL